MKTLFSFIVAVVLMAFVAPDASAQLQANANNFNYYYFQRLTGSAARAYAANTTDTLPNGAINTWYSSSPSTLPLGGSFIGLRMIVADSAYAYIYVDVKDGSTWTNSVYTDSVEVDNSDSVSVLIRGVATERLTGRLAGDIRIRVNWQNVTQGTTSATYRLDYLWKP